MKKEIPVFFAVDNNYAPFLGVTLQSLISNASPEYRYSIYVLTTKDIDEKNEKCILDFQREDFSIHFVSLQKKIAQIKEEFQLRDYYSMETYNRFFIAGMFPQYDKVLYLDCDIIINDDISKLYNIELGNNLVGAVPEAIVVDMEIFGQYVEKTLGVSRYDYFNAGILLMNTKKFREENIENRFITIMKTFKFRVAQDQDYLNVLCKGKVVKVDTTWNATASKKYAQLPSLVHYNLSFKPWHISGINYEEQFWQYAKKTVFYSEIKNIFDNYTEREKERDAEVLRNMIETATEDMNNPNNYYNVTKRVSA